MATTAGEIAQELCKRLNQSPLVDPKGHISVFAKERRSLYRHRLLLLRPEETVATGRTKVLEVRIDAFKFDLYFHGARKRWETQ